MQITAIEANVGPVCTDLEFEIDGKVKESVQMRTRVWRALRETIKFKVPVKEH